MRRKTDGYVRKLGGRRYLFAIADAVQQGWKDSFNFYVASDLPDGHGLTEMRRDILRRELRRLCGVLPGAVIASDHGRRPSRALPVLDIGDFMLSAAVVSDRWATLRFGKYQANAGRQTPLFRAEWAAPRVPLLVLVVVNGPRVQGRYRDRPCEIVLRTIDQYGMALDEDVRVDRAPTKLMSAKHIPSWPPHLAVHAERVRPRSRIRLRDVPTNYSRPQPLA